MIEDEDEIDGLAITVTLQHLDSSTGGDEEEEDDEAHSMFTPNSLIVLPAVVL